MPEMPEVEGLVRFLEGRVRGLTVTRAQVGQINALKTFDPPISALTGAEVTGAARHGKFLDLAAVDPESGEEVHLVFHLAKAGWLRWYEQAPSAPLKPGKGRTALRIGFSDDSGFDLTEAGTKKSLAVYVVREPEQVPGIARLGPDPMDDGFTAEVFAGLLAGRRTQIKGVLRDQGTIAGIGNAYSDEILHAAHISPFALADSLSEDEVQRLYAALQGVLAEAVAAAAGKPAAELKDAKRSGMRVHGRAGEVCPVCGDTVRSVSFADNSMEYCPNCQTGGKILADRRLSRLLK